MEYIFDVFCKFVLSGKMFIEYVMFMRFLVGLFSIKIVLNFLLGVWMKFIGGRICKGEILIVNVIVGFEGK